MVNYEMDSILEGKEKKREKRMDDGDERRKRLTLESCSCSVRPQWIKCWEVQMRVTGTKVGPAGCTGEKVCLMATIEIVQRKDGFGVERVECRMR